MAHYDFIRCVGQCDRNALTARLLHDDVALVIAFHLVRIFISIPLAPVLFGISVVVTRRWTQPPRTGSRDAAGTSTRHMKD